MFHPYWRELALRELDQPFDIVVVGGGITGCGILLDAAQRGLRTLLVERGDLASGTSSRSSKLIHGGLRYLKQMQFRVTRLACRERDRMLALSPHLVQPIRFIYPAYRGDQTPGWQVDLGLWMYDRLTDRVEKHGQLGRREVEKLAPGLVTAGLDRALAFTDALADDARLTAAVAATAHDYGASVLTRCTLEEATRSTHGRINGVVVRDLETLSTHRVETRVLVNATGVWTDEVRERLGLEGHHLRPSRGMHLVLPSNILPLRAAVSILSPDDGRPVFLIPHPEGVLLGTTDLYHEGSLDDPRPTHQEAAYLLRAANAAFPGHHLGAEHVRGAFAGLRPILDTYADEPSDASREEDIWEEDGVVSVAGGKLTTWRSTAETAVDAALQLLPQEWARTTAPNATRGTPLAGLAPPALADQLATAHDMEPALAAGMARRLGAAAWQVPSLARTARERRPVLEDLDLCTAEVRAHLRWGAVLHLDDLLLRRVRLGMWDPALARELAPRLRSVVRHELGWNGSRWEKELADFGEALSAWSPDGLIDGPSGQPTSDVVP